MKKYILPIVISLLIIGTGITVAATLLFPHSGGTGKDASGFTGYGYWTSGVYGTTTAVSGLSDLTLAAGSIYIGNASGNPEATSSIYIDVDGKIGIGTTTPSHTLDIEGTLGVLSTSTFLGRVGIGIASPSEKLDVAGAIKASGTIYGNRADRFAFYSISGGIYAAGSVDNYFGGNVGIGTSTPAFTLDVEGTLGVSGGVVFDSQATGTLAVNPRHLTILSQVEDLITTEADLYMASSTESGTGYNNLFQDIEAGPEQSIASSTLANTDGQLIATFIATSSVVTTLEAGLVHFHDHLEETGANNNTETYWVISTTSLQGFATSEVSAIITDKTSSSVHAIIDSDIELGTDQLVFRLYANVGSGSAGEITLYYEGDTASRVTIPAPTNVLDNVYLKLSGTSPLIGNWAVGGFNITGVGDFVATNASTTNLSITGLSDTVLAVDGNGSVVATTTAIGDVVYGDASTTAWDTSSGLTVASSSAWDGAVYTAGDYLTKTGNDIDLDVEIYTRSFSFTIENPTTTEGEAVVQWSYPYAITISKIKGSSGSGTTTIQCDERAEATPNTAGTDIMSAALELGIAIASTTAFDNDGIAIDAWINCDIDAVLGGATSTRISGEYIITD